MRPESRVVIQGCCDEIRGWALDKNDELDRAIAVRGLLPDLLPPRNVVDACNRVRMTAAEERIDDSVLMAFDVELLSPPAALDFASRVDWILEVTGPQVASPRYERP